MSVLLSGRRMTCLTPATLIYKHTTIAVSIGTRDLEVIILYYYMASCQYMVTNKHYLPRKVAVTSAKLAPVERA